ncbi:asparaginase domain-containing protein [Bdellovibrio sp. BCCA]|uniref:asparaginase domain-containing protein n=1 Tax=Bdellovibrio sp. BCCA TaxID=3136281 RepID=UPI0030EFB583
MGTSIQDVIIITTGGTIEKTYNEFDGSLENRGTSIKNLLLSKMRLPYTNIMVYPLLSKDSLYMTDSDRALIAATVKDQMQRGSPIVVLHGTDTMSITAEHCYKEIGTPKVPVVFTGAMIPMGFEDSDAAQNVTEALLTAKLMKPGFYISFHNQVFNVPNVRKNKEKGTFESF